MISDNDRPTDIVSAFLSSLDLVYWDYYHTDSEVYMKKIDQHRDLLGGLMSNRPSYLSPLSTSETQDSTSSSKSVKVIKPAGSDVFVAGAAWCWNRFYCALGFTLDASRACLVGCKVKGVDNVFMTIW